MKRINFIKSGECKRIILVGTTKLYNMLCEFLWEKKDLFLLCFIEYDNFNKRAYCRVWDSISNEKEVDLNHELLRISDLTLVVNAGAYYIYPPKVLDNKKLEIINYHSAILPNYKGVNASSWVIFFGEQYTGVTWHKVIEEIDSGEIFMQEKIEIYPEEKAYELSQRQIQKAYDLFEKFWDLWMNGKEIFFEPINLVQKERMFFLRETPNDGKIDLRMDSPDLISRVLRAVDYGKLTPFPPIELIDSKGRSFQVVRYKITENVLQEKPNMYYVKIEENKFIKIKVKEWSEG